MPFFSVSTVLLIIFIGYSLSRFLHKADAGLLNTGEVALLTLLKTLIALEVLLPIGLFFGLIGVIIGPFIGAFIGEITVNSKVRKAGEAGMGAWLGMLIGTAAKIAIGFTMVGIYIFARFA